MDNDIDVNFEAKNLNVGHTIAKSWHEMIEILLKPHYINPEIKYLQNDVIEPTSANIRIILKEQFKLENLSQIQVNVKPVILKMDYKDVDLVYTIIKKSEKMLESIEQADVFKNFSKKMTLKVGDAIN